MDLCFSCLYVAWLGVMFYIVFEFVWGSLEMVKCKSQVPLADLAEIVAAEREDSPQDSAAERIGRKIAIAGVMNRLKTKYGDDWVRTWDNLVKKGDR